MGTRTDEQWITIAEAAKRLGKDSSTLRKHLAQKHFESKRTEQGWHLVPWLDVQVFFANLAVRLPGVSCARPVNACNSQDSPESCTDLGTIHAQESHARARVQELEEALRAERMRADAVGRRNDELVERVLRLTEEVTSLSRTVVALLPAATCAAPRTVTGAVTERHGWTLNQESIDVEMSASVSGVSQECTENGRWLSVTEAAKVLGINRTTLSSRAGKGTVKSRHENGRLEVWVEQ